jgi:uncharacterized protein YqeY
VSLRDRLHEEMTAAMRSGDVLRRDTLRMVWSAVYAVEKRDHATLTDEQTVAVLAREVKTRRESVEAYRSGGREELAAKEEAEIAIIAGFLPQALTEAELTALVAEAIAATGASSARDLGKVMGWLSPRTRGRADGKVVSGMVGASLARADLAAPDVAGHGGDGPG